jgi:hypothetical protein
MWISCVNRMLVWYRSCQNILWIRSVGLWRRYSNITITILDIIHLSFETELISIGLSVYLTGNTLRLRYEPNRLMLSIGLWRWYINVTVTILDRAMDNVQICDSYILWKYRVIRSWTKWKDGSSIEMGRTVNGVFIACSKATARMYLESLGKKLNSYSEESVKGPRIEPSTTRKIISPSLFL